MALSVEKAASGGRRARLGRACAAALAALLAARPAVAEEAMVKIDNFSFNPAEIIVAPGDRVTWVNHDDIPHTVVGAADGLRSGALDTDDPFSFTFAAEGDYPYICSLHPHMTGRVVVKARR
ncbi:cupredoxin family copper-binding protein [Methylocella sp.]|uniref:cupredoxin family copper-binding protein n=1 Tax=Methylocella sp. TaxID=1978226 RepID=UPI00378415E2